MIQMVGTDKIRMNPKKHKGFIICRRLNKIVYIWHNAVEDKQNGWLCDCGMFIRLDPYYHSGSCEGVEI